MVLKTALVGLVLATSALAFDAPVEDLWKDLQVKREKLPSFHQEFLVTSITSGPGIPPRLQNYRLWVDGSGQNWRERILAGIGHYDEVFDGVDLYSFLEGAAEFVKTKPSPKNDDGLPLPKPYFLGRSNWAKAVENEREPCQLPGLSHNCVWLTVPLLTAVAGLSGAVISPASPYVMQKTLDGKAGIKLDLETGLILALREVTTTESFRGGTSGANAREHESEVTFTLERQAFGDAPEPALYHLPPSYTRQVSSLPRWDADRLNREWAGKPAPDLKLKDLAGRQFSLSAAKGKTVLLEFWATWCLPCRDKVVVLNKLADTFRDQNVIIVGIVVDEDRQFVDQFLTKYPHNFPVALTTENNMPRPYWASTLPTYMVIDKTGALAKITEGAPGLGEIVDILRDSTK